MQKRKVLIIEDERSIAENLIFTLENENFETKWCSLGKVGIDELKQNEFEFLILDINLPDVNGFEVCKQVRKFSNIPILILTARQDEIDKVVGLEIGADDYLSKPFSLRELVARMKAILRRAQDLKNQLSQVEKAKLPFKIDIDRYCIFYFEQKLPLTKYEFTILKSMLEHPGWIFSRDKLMDITIGKTTARFDRTVDAHIKSIRAKLKKIESSHEAIVTHRGIGYSIKDDW